MPSLNVFNNDVAQASLAPSAKVPERYAELWWYSGACVSYTTANSQTVVQKGSTSCALDSSGSASKLYTLSSSWPASTKFAFEATLQTSNGATTVKAQLYDITSAAAVASSTISLTTIGAFTVVRSGQFTLTPGHVYGVTLFVSGTNNNVQLTDASLIIFS